MENSISNLEKNLKEGNFVVTSEFGPPKGADKSFIEEKAKLLKDNVVAVNISDLQGANMSMDPLTTSHLLLNMGLEPIMQLTCRDRNRLSLQSYILSAYTLGIKNILALTGDYPTVGDHPAAYPVFDLDSVQLLWTIRILEQGKDLSGNKLTKKLAFFKGAAVNPEANSEASFELQIIKMKKKADCGAQFFQTMPIFDADKFKMFVDRVKVLNIEIPIIAGIQLIKSEKMANYMNKNLPGVNIPQDIIDKIATASDKVSASIDIAASIINKIKPYCSGIHIGAQGWEEHIPTLIKNIDV